MAGWRAANKLKSAGQVAIESQERNCRRDLTQVLDRWRGYGRADRLAAVAALAARHISACSRALCHTRSTANPAQLVQQTVPPLMMQFNAAHSVVAFTHVRPDSHRPNWRIGERNFNMAGRYTYTCPHHSVAWSPPPPLFLSLSRTSFAVLATLPHTLDSYRQSSA